MGSEALELAERLERYAEAGPYLRFMHEAAALLRSQDARVAELEKKNAILQLNLTVSGYDEMARIAEHHQARVAELEKERDEARDEVDECRIDIKTLAAERDALQRRLAEAVEGLTPLVDSWRELRAEDDPTFGLDPDEPITIEPGWLKVGDVWRARALLAKHKDTPHG